MPKSSAPRLSSQGIYARLPFTSDLEPIQLTVSGAKAGAKKKNTLNPDQALLPTCSWGAASVPRQPPGKQDLLSTVLLLQTLLTRTLSQSFLSQDLLVKMWHIAGWFLETGNSHSIWVMALLVLEGMKR